jgi:hypothetical protein
VTYDELIVIVRLCFCHRAAATRSREKKKQWLTELEHKAANLQHINTSMKVPSSLEFSWERYFSFHHVFLMHVSLLHLG